MTERDDFEKHLDELGVRTILARREGGGWHVAGVVDGVGAVAQPEAPSATFGEAAAAWLRLVAIKRGGA